MRITLHENEVLNAIAKSLPAASSVKKLVTVTGKARDEIIEILVGLQKLQYLNVTEKNEVALLKDGRTYLGVFDTKVQTEQEALAEIVKSDEPQGVLLSIEQLAEKLNQPTIEISDIELKSQVLTRLAELLSEDVANVLLDIKADLEKTAA